LLGPVVQRPRLAAAAGDCTVTGAEVALDAEEAAFLTLINNYRAQNGRQPLKISYKLTRASIWKSKHMAQNDYFAHDDTPIGRSWSARISDCGYNHGTYIGENIAAGYFSATNVFEGWRNSPGHNSNMLSTSFTAIGIGRYQGAGTFGTYWTTVFGGYDDGWMAVSVVAPAAGDGVDGTSPVTSSTVSNPAPGSGWFRRSGGLDFGSTCRGLLERRHPLAAWFCPQSPLRTR
jgi:uncharacterized protein YkwD